MIDRGKSALGIKHRQFEVAQHAEGLWTGNLVDEVGSNEELGHAIGQLTHGVRLPDFIKQRFAHKKVDTLTGECGGGKCG